MADFYYNKTQKRIDVGQGTEFQHRPQNIDTEEDRLVSFVAAGIKPSAVTCRLAASETGPSMTPFHSEAPGIVYLSNLAVFLTWDKNSDEERYQGRVIRPVRLSSER